MEEKAGAVNGDWTLLCLTLSQFKKQAHFALELIHFQFCSHPYPNLWDSEINKTSKNVVANLILEKIISEIIF